MALVSGVGGGSGGSATKSAYQTAAKKAATAKKVTTPKVTAPKATKPPVTKLPVQTPPINEENVPVGTPMVGSPGESLGQSELTPAEQWTLESDPLYQMALSGGQSEFNYSRNAALADKQGQESAAAAERKSLDTGSTEARRRLAGNYAARGMAGGAAGALSQAEARANAEQIAARTSIQNKLDALNQQFLSNYGAVGSDWTGTLAGQQYKSQAAQQALSAQLARYGSI